MAIFEVQAPDGAILRVEGPDNATDDEVISYAQAQYTPTVSTPPSPISAPGTPIIPPIAPQTSLPMGERPLIDAPMEIPAAPQGDFMRGLNIGLEGIAPSVKASGQALLDAFGVSDQAQLPVTAPAPMPLDATKPKFGSFENAFKAGDGFVETAGNLIDQGQETIGQAVASQVLPLAGRVAGGIAGGAITGGPIGTGVGAGVGAFSGSAAQIIGEVASSVKQAAAKKGIDISNQEASKIALMYSAPAAALEMIPGAGIEKAAKGAAVKEITERALSDIVKKFAKETGKGALEEGVTEAGQEVIKQGAVAQATDENMLTTENLKQAAESGIAGALGGGAMRGVATGVGEVSTITRDAINKLKEPKQTQEQTAKAPVQEQPAPPPPPPQVKPEPAPVMEETVKPAEQPAEAPAPQPQKGTSKIYTPGREMQIDATDEVVEADSLIQAEGDIQQRDRNKATSDLQIQTISAKLDPEWLAESRTTDQGAPIVGPDNRIESGNGRTSAIKMAYESNPQKAEEYRKFLQSRGHNIEGMKHPILIRRRTSELSPEERTRFTTLSNKSQIAEMSSTEKAKSDAAQLSNDVLRLHKGGSTDSVGNLEFMTAFLKKVASPNELGALIGTDKMPTQEGIKRASAALVSKAYEDSNLVENIFDNPDPEVKSLGNVLKNRAPEFAQLKADVEEGNVPKRFDISQDIMKAVETIRDSKRNGKPISEALEGSKQTTFIDEGKKSPVVDMLIRAFYKDDLTRMVSQKRMDEVLSGYVKKAQEQTEATLFGKNETQPEDILDEVLDVEEEVTQEEPDKKTPMLFDQEDEADTDTNLSNKKPEENAEDEFVKTDGRTTTDFSYNENQNRVKSAFTDMGVSPESSMNLPPVKQIKILKDGFKSRFNIDVIIDNSVNLNNVINQLADMYVSLQFMAHSLGMSSKVLGLEGTLSLNITKTGRFLGQYSNNNIKIPRRSNSFAHEWLHALDDHLIGKFTPDNLTGDLFSKIVRKDGVIDPNDGVQAAFANLLNTIFYDKSFLASKTLELESKLDKARSEKVKEEIQKTLNQIKNGSYKGIKGKNNYYKGVKQFNDSSYWSSPEEMMARAFEAYMGYKISELGGMSEGNNKSNIAYLSSVDERLAKTFPKATDRLAIFEAFDQFFARLQEKEILGKDMMPDELPDTDMAMLDTSRWDKMFPDKFANQPFFRRVYSRQMEALKDFINLKRRELKDAQDKKDMGIVSPKSISAGLWTIRDNSFSALRDVLHSYENKYKSAPALREANDRLVSRPGEVGSPRSVFSSDVEKIAAKQANRVGNIGANFGAKDFTDAELSGVRDIMQSREYNGTNKDNVNSVAAGLRDVLNTLFAEAEKAGIKIGYFREYGYLSRLYKKEIILAKRDEFIEKAAEVYAIQFEKIIGTKDEAINKAEEFIEAINELLKSGDDTIPVNQKDLNKMLGIIENAKENNIDLKDTDLKNIIDKIYDDVKTAHSMMSAKNWLYRIEVGRDESLEGSSPYAGFTKKRALPAEADTILADFMETNPFEITHSYVEKMANAIALHRVLNPKGKTSMEKLYTAMKNQGIPAEDVDLIRNYHDSIMGRIENSASVKKSAAFLSRMYTISTIMQLGRAVISSLQEPFVFTMQTMEVKTAFKSLLMTVEQIIETDDIKKISEMARHIGLVTDDFVDASIDSRFGGGMNESVADRKVLSNFFRKTMLTPLTNSQRVKILALTYRHLVALNEEMKDSETSATRKAQIKRFVSEWGVSEKLTPAFLKWIEKQDGFPSQDALKSPLGRLFLDVVWNINKRTIQDPKREDKPYYSSSPAGRIVWAITAFNFAFYSNVTKAIYKRLKTTREIDGNYEMAKMAGKVVSAYATLFAATLFYQTLRVAIMDREKWKELSKKDELMPYILNRALDNTGIYGPVFSLLNNLVTGVKYSKDIATSFSGAHLSAYFDFMGKMISLAFNNSANTNTAEYAAAKSTFKTIIGTYIAWVLSKAPGGPVLGPAAGVGIMFATSQTASDEFAKLIAGPKGKDESKGRAKKSKSSGKRATR